MLPPPTTRGEGALRVSNNKISVFVLTLNKAKPQNQKNAIDSLTSVGNNTNQLSNK